jgi:hypothetical protein
VELFAEGRGLIGGRHESDAVRGGQPEYTSFADLDQGSHLTDFVEPELQSIEEQLRASIVDASQEVQSAIGGWETAGGGRNTIEASHSPADLEVDVVLPAADADYDVIEPATRGRSSSDALDGILSTDDEVRSPGRYIPKPKYRHVFSTLRRRLGTTFRRKS